MMLAQVTNNLGTGIGAVGDSLPLHLAEWVACAAFFMWFVLLCMKFAERVKGKPAASEVRSEAAERYVVKTDCHAWMRKHELTQDNIFSKVGGVERGAQQKLSEEIKALREERREDMDKLSEKMSSIAEDVAGLETATQMQNQTLASMTAKLDRLAERKAAT